MHIVPHITRMYNKDMKFQLLYLFIAAALIRFISINQSLWLDEAIVANVTKNLGLLQILSQFSPTDFHPPLYYLFMDIWTAIFGYSEISLRLPSIIFSLIAGYAVYLSGKKLYSQETGFWAAALFLVNPLGVYFSQEARMYSMVTMWISLAMYYLILLWKDYHWDSSKALSHTAHTATHSTRSYWKDILFVNIFLGLAFVTFYGSVFFILAVYILLLWKKQVKHMILLSPGPALALVIVAPLLIQQWNYSKTALADITNWSAVLGTPNLKNLLLIPMKFVLGKISFEPKIVYYGLSGVSSLVVGLFVFKGAQKHRNLLFLLLAPLAIAFIFSFTSPLLQYFRFLYLLPVLALLLAVGTRSQVAARAVVMGIFLVSTAAYLFIPAFHREDWKHALSGVPESLPVYVIHSVSDPLMYYYPTYTLVDLKSIERDPIPGTSIVVIPYAADIHGFPYTQLLKLHAMHEEEKVNVRGIVVEFWERNPVTPSKK